MTDNEDIEKLYMKYFIYNFSLGKLWVLCLFFPFLYDSDFNHFVGNWSVPNLNETVDLFDPFPNPDKN